MDSRHAKWKQGTVATALVGALFATASVAAGTGGGPGGADPNHLSARDLFRELIEINTTAAQGSGKAAEAMAARLRAAGFAAEDLQLAGPRPQNQNLVIRYRGAGGNPTGPRQRPILFFAHLDVVEALRTDWSFDPFVFLEKDGFFYGRGTTDMKCEVADIVANLIRLRREGFVPRRDILIALTEHEESGDANGMKWLLANRRDLVDVEYAINLEGGGGNSKAGKPILMEVQTSEKTYVDVQLEIRNKGGHSSQPVRDNAMVRMGAALSRIGAYDFPVRLNETTRIYFQQHAKAVPGALSADMARLADHPEDAAAAARLSAANPYYNALLRTTCVPTMIQGGHAENALPQHVRVNVNCRLLPDDTADNVVATLRRVIADDQITIALEGRPVPSPLSPLRKDVMAIVTSLTAQTWPTAVVTPIMATGATDGKHLRRAGIPVYGVSGMYGDIDDTRAHGRDERIAVDDFYRGVDFMYRFVKELTK